MRVPARSQGTYRGPVRPAEVTAGPAAG